MLFSLSIVANGFHLGGARAAYAAIWEEYGCSHDQAILFELLPILIGHDYVYLDFKIIGCYDYIAGAEGRIGGRAGGEDGPGTISLKQPRNGFINYDAGTCSGNCRITPVLPHGAQNSLGEIPGGVDATLYVNLGGGTGTYQTCFYGGGTIYQRISGAWQSVATSIGGGMSCAFGAGDGSFAFVEN